MTAKQKKLFLLTSMMSVFVMAVAVLFTGGKISMSPFGVRGTEQIVDGSITWSTSVSSKSGSGNKISYLSRTSRGTGIYLYSFGQYNPTGTSMFSSKYNEANDFGIYIKSEAGQSGSMFEFQSITSISITVGTSSQSGTSFEIYTSSTKVSPVKSQTGVSPGQTYSYSTEVANGKFLAIRPTSSINELQITSVTVNYSCVPGGIPTEKSLSSISISGQSTNFTVGDSFVFGGTVTAHYTDLTSADVTSSSTFSGYNMSESGEQTVTVTYTEGGTTKTAEYNILISGDSQDVVLSGTYNYSERTDHLTPSWEGKMSITFTSSTECCWRNYREATTFTNEYDAKVYFTYSVVESDNRLNLSLTFTSYDFKVNGTSTNKAAGWSGTVNGSTASGGTSDRPCNGFAAGATNNSGFLDVDKNILTIDVFVYSSGSYSRYDTFKFTKVS